MAGSSQPIEVFYSYAHEDEASTVYKLTTYATHLPAREGSSNLILIEEHPVATENISLSKLFLCGFERPLSHTLSFTGKPGFRQHILWRVDPGGARY
jgi:hypothetical protein